MGRKSVDEFWLRKINELTANHPKVGPKAAAQRFEKDPDCAERADWPSESTIGRYQREFRKKDPAEQIGYCWFHWPESMEIGALPWEAGPTALELLRWRRKRGGGAPLPRYRPVIAHVRWFWRVTAIAAKAPFLQRYKASVRLVTLEMGGIAPPGDKWKRDVELWATLTPWRSDADAQAYQVALAGEGECLTGEDEGGVS